MHQSPDKPCAETFRGWQFKVFYKRHWSPGSQLRYKWQLTLSSVLIETTGGIQRQIRGSSDNSQTPTWKGSWSTNWDRASNSRQQSITPHWNPKIRKAFRPLDRKIPFLGAAVTASATYIIKSHLRTSILRIMELHGQRPSSNAGRDYKSQPWCKKCQAAHHTCRHENKVRSQNTSKSKEAPIAHSNNNINTTLLPTTYRMKSATVSNASVPYLTTKTIEDLANIILYEVTYYRKTFIWMFWWEAQIQSQSVELLEMKS